MESELSKEERENILIEREKKLVQQYKTGKIIVSAIAILYIVFTIISLIIKLNVFGLIINISVAWALFYGAKWSRIYYAISVGLGVLIFAQVLFNPTVSSQLPMWGLVLSFLQIFVGIISSILLFKSKAVIEFMETQREMPY